MEYNKSKRSAKKMEYFYPKKQDKEVISIRIAVDLLQQVDKCAAKADISRNEFINQCIVFALDHMDDKQ